MAKGKVTSVPGNRESTETCFTSITHNPCQTLGLIQMWKCFSSEILNPNISLFDDNFQFFQLFSLPLLLFFFFLHRLFHLIGASGSLILPCYSRLPASAPSKLHCLTLPYSFSIFSILLQPVILLFFHWRNEFTCLNLLAEQVS